MSDGKRFEAKEARKLAENVVFELAELCQKIEIAGSLRRGRSDVGDVEIVAWAHNAPTLLARLDVMVATGKIKKSIYSDGRTRWGAKYRGLSVDGLRIEIFLADQHNWGYVYWLRTGPGDANQYVMQQLIYQHAPYGPQEGYWWAAKQKISVPDEGTLFKLLGIPRVIQPSERSIQTYHRFMAQAKWAQEVEIITDAPTISTQSSMF